MPLAHDTAFEGYRIPFIEGDVRAGGSYHDIPVNLSDPRNREPLVPLRSVNVAFECYYARTDGNNPPFCRPLAGSHKDVWSRRSVAEKLTVANRDLRPFGVEVLVLEGHRTIECQRSLWSFFIEDAKSRLTQPSERECRDYALERVGDPRNFDPDKPGAWQAHTTGAALDLTLRHLGDGAPVDMGSRIEEVVETSRNDYFERLLERGEIGADDPRLRNRRLLHWAMNRQGFLNDPFVFWHHDWGNQLYVKICRASGHRDAPAAAWYGYIAEPGSDDRLAAAAAETESDEVRAVRR